MLGRTVLSQNSIYPTRVSFDGSPQYKAGGILIDWANLVAAVGSDTTLADGSVIKSGQKYLRYGQILCKTNYNQYGPYDSAATDGRQTLTRGRCFILDQTVTQYGAGSAGLSSANDVVGNVFDGGSVWRNRILCTNGAASLAAGPTESDMLAAFPNLQIVRDE